MISMGDLMKSSKPSLKDLEACARKRPFTGEIEARIRALVDLEEREYKGVTEMWIYVCPVCGYWHTTSVQGSPAFKVTRDKPQGD